MTIDDSPLFCAKCLTKLTPGLGEFFVVSIEAVADPTPPTFTAEDLQRDHLRDFESLVEQLGNLSERELMDQVHRKTVIHLCNRCFGEWFENPVGS
jgi:hypothetical protein